RATFQRELRNWPAALADLQHALQCESGPPERSEDYAQCGAILGQLGRHVEAVDYLSKAVALREDQAWYHLKLTEELLKLERPEDAAHSLERYFKWERQRPTAHAHYLRGVFRLQADDRAGAVADFTIGLQATPTPAGYNYRGFAYLNGGAIP